jgi:hypothetical protein
MNASGRMRRLMPFFAGALLLGGCSYAWVRPDATPQQASSDDQACRAQAANVVNGLMYDPSVWPGAWGPPSRRWGPGWYTGSWADPSAELAAQQRVYDGCMRARGYNLVRVDRKTGEPR